MRCLMYAPSFHFHFRAKVDQSCPHFILFYKVPDGLPGRLHALSNEVSDIELVLCQVASVLERRNGYSALKDQETYIQHLLNQAGSRLTELRQIVETLTSIARTTKIPIFRAHARRKHQPRLQALQEDIKTVKCSLNIMLGASNSQDMMRIWLDLDTISTSSSDSAQNQASMEENLQTTFVRHRDDPTEFLAHAYPQVDQRVGNVEELLKTQTAQLTHTDGDRLIHDHPRPLEDRHGTRILILKTVLE